MSHPLSKREWYKVDHQEETVDEANLSDLFNGAEMVTVRAIPNIINPVRYSFSYIINGHMYHYRSIRTGELKAKMEQIWKDLQAEIFAWYRR